LLYAVIRFGRWPEAGLSRLADAFVLGGAALALAGLWSYFVAGYLEHAEGVSRLLVPSYDSPNHISLYLGRTASVAFCMAFFSAARARRWLHAVSVGVMLAAFYLTYSRAGWLLGLPVAALTVALFAGRRRVAVALAAIALAALAILPVLATPRFGSLLTLAEGTAESRLLLWQGTARMIAAHPVLGVGIGNFYAAYPRFMLPDAWREPLLYHAHNAALDSWSMLGIVGLAAFVWLEVAFWRMALQLRRVALSPDMRALLIGLAASMAYALAHGLVDTLYFLPDLALAFMLTMGMVIALEETDLR
jgi:O-antigen ligase